MKIEYKETNPVTKFGELSIGECFSYYGTIYMRTNPISTYDADGETVYNAVCMEDGSRGSFRDYDTVYFRNMKLVEV